jgi:spermidine/putrescine transport system permease protein
VSRAKIRRKGASHGIQRHGGSIIHKVALAVLVLMWFPMLTLVILSFSGDGLLAFPPATFSAQWYVEVFTSEQAISSLSNTVKVALAATPIAMVLGMLTVIGIDRYEFTGKNAVLLLIITPLLIPAVVGALAVFQVVESLRLQGFWPVVAVHVLKTLPFATLVLLETFSNFDESLEKAAMDLGASEIKTFGTVTIPNIANGIVAAGLLAFTFSFNEFIFTYFVRSSGMMTLPVYLWNKTVYGLTPAINAISVIFLFVAMLVVALVVSVSSVRKAAA